MPTLNQSFIWFRNMERTGMGTTYVLFVYQKMSVDNSIHFLAQDDFLWKDRDQNENIK